MRADGQTAQLWVLASQAALQPCTRLLHTRNVQTWSTPKHGRAFACAGAEERTSGPQERSQLSAISN